MRGRRDEGRRTRDEGRPSMTRPTRGERKYDKLLRGRWEGKRRRRGRVKRRRGRKGRVKDEGRVASTREGGWFLQGLFFLQLEGRSGDIAILGVDLVNWFGCLKWNAIREAAADFLPVMLSWERWCTAQDNMAFLPAGGSVQIVARRTRWPRQDSPGLGPGA